MPAWTLLALAPRAAITQKLVHSFAYPFFDGLLYFGLLFTALVFMPGSGNAGMGSLSGVITIFSRLIGILTGWTHYLVFDLFVGVWISRDAIARGVKHWIIVPCLFFTLMFGPIGLFLYWVVRLAMNKGDLTLE